MYLENSIFKPGIAYYGFKFKEHVFMYGSCYILFKDLFKQCMHIWINE
jgi:hypothetical protein